MDELLDALPASEPPPEFSAFTLQANADVEEGAAGAFQGNEFGQGLVVRGIGRKLELKAVRQFLDAQDGRMQNLAEFLLSFALFRGQGCAIAEEWGFLRSFCRIGRCTAAWRSEMMCENAYPLRMVTVMSRNIFMILLQ